MQLGQFLEKDLTEQPSRVKYQHLAAENANLLRTVGELQRNVRSLRKLNQQLLLKSPQSIQLLVEELTNQNLNLEQSVFRLLRINQQLSCDVLMKDQLLCEAEREHREIVGNYDEKIYELRASLQAKEVAMSAIEEKGNQLKEEQFGSATRVNLMYYNEINELKAMHDRIALENHQLSFLNALKDQELDKLRAQLARLDKALEKKEEWKSYRETIQTVTPNEQTRTRKQDARHKLEEELTRYDNKYKSTSSTKGPASASQAQSLRFVITHLNKENRQLRAALTRIQADLGRKNQHQRALQQAHQQLERELLSGRVQVQFYRDNFRELSKVNTERKIRYYSQHYSQMLPTLERKLHEKERLSAFWKHCQATVTQMAQKCILGGRKKVVRGSSSCIARFGYLLESPRKKLCGKEKEEAIFSFINETHNVDSLINYTMETKQPSVHPEPFQDDISVIIKPLPETPFRRKQQPS